VVIFAATAFHRGRLPTAFADGRGRNPAARPEFSQLEAVLDQLRAARFAFRGHVRRELNVAQHPPHTWLLSRADKGGADRELDAAGMIMSMMKGPA
jgi:hypothetical protein